MKITYEAIMGDTFQAESKRAIVLQMARRDFLAVGKTDYMQDVKERCSSFGFDIDITSFDSFLLSLETAGLLKEIKNI